jgi:hypothetical protein
MLAAVSPAGACDDETPDMGAIFMAWVFGVGDRADPGFALRYGPVAGCGSGRGHPDTRPDRRTSAWVRLFGVWQSSDPGRSDCSNSGLRHAEFPDEA